MWLNFNSHGGGEPTSGGDADVSVFVCLCTEWCLQVVTAQCDCQLAEQHPSWVQTLALCALTEESAAVHDLQPAVIHITTTTISTFFGAGYFIKMTAPGHISQQGEDHFVIISERKKKKKLWIWEMMMGKKEPKEIRINRFEIFARQEID